MTATITIIDDLHPEDNAMLQALQSRSPASVAERLKKVRTVGSGQFMNTYYVGYGAALYVDEEPSSWTVRRGKQTITEKD